MAESEMMTPVLDDAWEPVTRDNAVQLARRFFDGEEEDYWPMVTIAAQDGYTQLDILGVREDGRMVVDIDFSILFRRLAYGYDKGDRVIFSPCTIAVIMELLLREWGEGVPVTAVFDKMVLEFNQELTEMGIDESYRFFWRFMKEDDGLMPPVMIGLNKFN